MAEPKPISVGANEEEVNLLERAEKETSSPTDQNKEEPDVEATSIVNTRDVKAPNFFDRAKEEIAAIVQTIHPNKQQKNDDQLEATTSRSVSEADSPFHGKFEKVVNFIERGKEEIGAIIRNRKESETHGLRDDIDENTPLSEVKGPSVFERAKEELEAIVNAIKPKKESASTPTSCSSTDDAAPSSSDGFWVSIGRKLEKICCSPFDRKKD